MKKSNAQAETHSNRAGALRGSRPRTDIFFYFYLDYKHTATGVASHVPHLPPLPPLNIDYKHKRATPSMCEIFFIF